MIAVVDTSVWVSALINPKGFPARIVESLQRGDFVSAASRDILAELHAVLAKPPPPGTIKIVSVGWEMLQDIVRKQVYQERKEDFNKAFGIRPGESIGGGGS